jgi:hypothetical protein
MPDTGPKAPFFPIIYVGAEPRPSSVPTHDYLYDLAFSYAGEDRGYVERLAAELQRRRIRVFYDREQIARVLGQDLAEILPRIYEREARYCVVFASEHYSDSQWTAVESDAALRRQRIQKGEYIIPIRLAEVSVPGLSRSIVYYDASAVEPEQVADLLTEKLGGHLEIFTGLNATTTRIRQLWSGSIENEIIPSALAKLVRDFGYVVVDEKGLRSATDPLPARSFIDFADYQWARHGTISGKWRGMEAYAADLGDLILEIRDRFSRQGMDGKGLRVNLVAYSLGGLICRCLLQNPRAAPSEAKNLVAKLFTCATPHGGLDPETIEAVSPLFLRDEMEELRTERMSTYLACEVSSIDEMRSDRFDESAVFNVIGTEALSYARAEDRGPPFGDGLVMPSRACVRRAPRAFVPGGHGGETSALAAPETYENLHRFLFGDVRVDGSLTVRELPLPPTIQKAYDQGKRVRGSYFIEVRVRPRGLAWDLHRRLVAERSAIFRTADELVGMVEDLRRMPVLFSSFLAGYARSSPRRTLALHVQLQIPIPDYEIDGIRYVGDDSGGYLYRDTVNLQISPHPGGWRMRYGFDSRSPGRATVACDIVAGDDGVLGARVPIVQKSRPGIVAELEIALRLVDHDAIATLVVS